MAMRSSTSESDRIPAGEEAGSSEFATRVHEVLCRVAEVVEAPDALDLLAIATSDLGASASCFVSAVRDTDGGAAAYRMLLACDPRWGARYMQNSWFETDPWLAYAMRAEVPILASSLTPDNDAQHCMLSSAAEHGFRSTVIAPAPSGAGVSRVGVLYVGSAVDGFFEGDGYRTIRPLAQALAMELHAWWMRVLRDELMRGSRITGDEVALLRHEAVGHGSKVIAAELHTEAKTIDCRFQRLNAKLGARNRRAAVRIARFYGLL
jgi:DNA-binding NarL/FixJ family response regulator